MWEPFQVSTKISSPSDHEPSNPRWAPSGEELFYQDSQGRIVAVEVETESGFIPGSSDVLIDGPDGSRLGLNLNYDIDLDAKRFLLVKEISATSDEAADSQFTVVLNWFEELKARVPLP